MVEATDPVTDDGAVLICRKTVETTLRFHGKALFRVGHVVTVHDTPEAIAEGWRDIVHALRSSFDRAHTLDRIGWDAPFVDSEGITWIKLWADLLVDPCEP